MHVMFLGRRAMFYRRLVPFCDKNMLKTLI